MSIDINGATWKAIAFHLQERLDRARVNNDSPSLSEQETAVLRGEIRALKELQSLPSTLAARDVGSDLGYGVGSQNDDDED
jgi:hypothetical protein